VVAPLTNLLVGSVKGKKVGPFVFLQAAWDAFSAIKLAFTTALMLQHFNPALRIMVELDALGFALTRIISQPDPSVEAPK